MARIDVGMAERPLAQHKRGSHDWSATKRDDNDEKRAAAPVDDDGDFGKDDEQIIEGVRS